MKMGKRTGVRFPNFKAIIPDNLQCVLPDEGFLFVGSSLSILRETITCHLSAYGIGKMFIEYKELIFLNL